MKLTISLPSFPHSVENWWWAEAVKNWPEWGNERLLNSLRKEIISQSDRFNKGRSFDPSSYGSRDLSIFAYGNFYFSRTWISMTFVIAEVFARCNWSPPKKGPIRILDLGSGTGSSGLASLHLLRNFGIKNPIELTAWDYSLKSLSFLKSLHLSCSNLWPETRVFLSRGDLRTFSRNDQKENFDLILLGFSFNEIMQDQEILEQEVWLQEICNFMKSSGFLIITEPAEMTICRKLQINSFQVQKKNKNLFIHGPYFNGMPCPLTEGKNKFFSHEVRSYNPLKTVETINRPLRLEIGDVKYGFTILSPTSPNKESSGFQLFRLISPVKKRKGTISFHGMGTDGKEYLYEFQRRDLNKKETHDLQFLERGDVLRLQEAATKKIDNRIRLNSAQSIKGVFIPRLQM